MRLLISGACGQLGHELLTIIESGAADIGPVSGRFTDAQVVATDVVADQPAEVGFLDITDARAVDATLAEGAFDWVVNCAAATNVDGCEANPEFALALNAQGPENLARACAACGTRLLHISTDYVLAGTDPAPQPESAVPAPRTTYGKTKLEGERLVTAAAPNSVIVRTAWLYGSKGKNFVRTMAGLGRTHEAVRVVDDQHGSPTNANDLAYELLRIMEWADEVGDAASGIWHVTGNGATTWADFARRIFELCAIPCEVVGVSTEEWGAPAWRPSWSILDHRRLRDTIGDAMREWDVALASFVASNPDL